MERSKELKLSAADRKTLEKLIARPSAPAGHVRRARVVLLSAQGVKGKEIAMMVGISPEYVSRIRKRFQGSGVDGLAERKRGGRTDHAVPAETIERIVQTTLSPPPAGRTRWTTRLLGRKFGLTSWTISKILRANELKPHLVRTYKVSRDPAFAAKVRDVVGLYLNPPTTRSCSALTRKHRSKRWSGRSCHCRCDKDEPRDTRTTTSGTACWTCTQR
jgi:transposase